MCENAELDPKKEDQNSRHKIIIFSKNNSGCKLLNQIYSEAFTDLHKSTDAAHLKKLWDDKHLKLAIPFYDSFIFNNTMRFGNCVPDLSFTAPTFFIEKNGLPFDSLIESRVNTYASKNNYKTKVSNETKRKNNLDEQN